MHNWWIAALEHAGIWTREQSQHVSENIRLTTHRENYKEAYEELTDIIAQTKPLHMSVEKLFFAQNVTTAMTVAQARGVVLLAGMQASLKISEYTPLQIKQALTGYGRAEKKQMQETENERGRACKYSLP